MKRCAKTVLTILGPISVLFGAGSAHAWVVVRGAAVGVAAGAAVGAAAAHAAYAHPPTTVVVPAPAPPPPPSGVVTSLPGGCRATAGPSGTLYQCANGWYQPYFGGGAVYYQPVPPPH